MRERQDGLFRLLKKIYSGLQGYLDSDVDVEIQPIKLGFSICFRHDMDRFDERGFDEFMQFEEQFDAPATLFFLESQVSRFGERIRKVTGEKFEMALHSEAKPNLIHPWHAVCNGQSQFYELKRMIIEWCQRNDIPVLRCRDYLSSIKNSYV